MYCLGMIFVVLINSITDKKNDETNSIWVRTA